MKYGDFKLNKESVDKFFPKEDIDILGYESPLQVMMKQMRMEQEDNIFKAIQEYGVNVDRDELIKALQYDRDQYEKGYINGYKAGASDVAREIFEEIEEIVIANDYISVKDFYRDHPLIAELKKKYTQEK